MITKTGTSILIIAITTTLFSVFMRDIYFYIVTSLCWSMLIFGFIISRFKLKSIVVARCLPKAVFAGQRARVIVNLKNESVLREGPLRATDYFDPSYSKESEHPVFISTLGEEPVEYSYETLCKKRGLCNIGPFSVESADLLGLFKIRQHIDSFSELVVYPAPFNINYLPITRGVPSFGGEASRLAGDYEEFYGIREYRIDDGLRKIHWSSSARHMELMVKQYRQGATHKITIIVDTAHDMQADWNVYDSFECSVKIAASVAKYLADKKMDMQFIAESFEPFVLPMKNGQEHFFEILDSLARVNSDSETTLERVLDKYDRIIPAGSCVVLIFSKAQPQILPRLARLSVRRINVISIYLEDSGDDVFSKELQDSCSDVYIIKESDVKDIENKFL